MTLSSLVSLATSRRLKIGVLVLWLLSLVSIFTFVRESHEKFPGGSEDRYNYFEIHRSALFVWLSLSLVGYAAHHFKQRSPGWYGVIEIVAGIVGGFVAVQRLPIEDPGSWFALAASAYVMVRGAGNVDTGLKEEEKQKLATEASPVSATATIEDDGTGQKQASD